MGQWYLVPTTRTEKLAETKAMPQTSAEQSLSIPRIAILYWGMLIKSGARQTLIILLSTSPILLAFGVTNTVPGYVILSFVGVTLMTTALSLRGSERIYGNSSGHSSEANRGDGQAEQEAQELRLPAIILMGSGGFSALLLATIVAGYIGSLLGQFSLLGIVLAISFPSINYWLGRFDERLRISYSASGAVAHLLQIAGVIDEDTDLDEARDNAGV